jgi:hypothetical protein
MAQLIDPGLFKEDGPDTGARPFANPYADARSLGKGFKDPRRLGTALICALVFSIVADTLTTLGVLVLRPDDPSSAADETFAVILGLIVLCMLIGLGLRLLMLMLWVYRSNKNARTVSSGIETTPGWAVGFFFVPVLSWIRPYQTMSEIWRSAMNPLGWRSMDDPVFLRVWWGLWVAGGVLATATNFLEVTGPGVFFYLTLTVGVAANALLVFMVRTVSRNQWEQRDASVFD